MRGCAGIIFTTLVLSTAIFGGAQDLLLHDGDRVVFYGDSITAQRLYTRFAEDFVLTRYPQLHVAFWNAGVPGDTVYGGYTGDMSARLKRDLLPHQPTVVTIMLGMNDGYYMAFDPKYLQVYEDGYRKLLAAIHDGAPSARVMILSPTPYDEITHGTEFAHYSEVVGRHAGFDKELASSSHLAFSDFHQTEKNLLQAGMRNNPSLAALLVTDRIHPAEASHWAMAAALAGTWGVRPVVSSVRLDAKTHSAVSMEHAEVVNLTMKDGTLHWTQTDDALPLPLPLDDTMIQFVLSISDLAAMDQQMLRVDGLTAEQYRLKIDGHEVGSFRREQLAMGINLGRVSTPMEGQARGVDSIELKRMRLDEARFVLAIEEPKAEGNADTIKAIEAKDAALMVEQRKMAQPLPHTFDLSPK